MSIEKKSLISNRIASKKAIVTKPEVTKVANTPLKSVHAPLKSVHAPLKSVHAPLKTVGTPLKTI